MKLFVIFYLLILSWASLAFDEDRIERLKWGDLEVVYIEDLRFPTYRVSFYFADGALSDGAIKERPRPLLTS